MRQIFNALEYIHGKEIVHTDMKLENLVFDDVPFRPREEFRRCVAHTTAFDCDIYYYGIDIN